MEESDCSAVEGGGGVIRNMRVDVMQNNAMLRCWDAMCQDCNWVVSSYKSDLAYKWGLHIYKMPGVFDILTLRLKLLWSDLAPEWWRWWGVTMFDNDRDKRWQVQASLTAQWDKISDEYQPPRPLCTEMRPSDADLLDQVNSSAVNDKAFILKQNHPELTNYLTSSYTNVVWFLF